MRVKNYKTKTTKRKSRKKTDDDFWAKYKAKRQREWNSEWYKALRKSVFERDGYTCALTGKTGGLLNLHHIKRYYDCPSMRFDRKNLITLSKEAHEAITGKEKEYEKKLSKIARKREKEARNGKDKSPKSRK